MDPGLARHFNDRSELTEFVSSMVKEGDVVLVKGSRGMQLEKLVEHLA